MAQNFEIKTFYYLVFFFFFITLDSLSVIFCDFVSGKFCNALVKIRKTISICQKQAFKETSVPMLKRWWRCWKLKGFSKYKSTGGKAILRTIRNRTKWKTWRSWSTQISDGLSLLGQKLEIFESYCFSLFQKTSSIHWIGSNTNPFWSKR